MQKQFSMSDCLMHQRRDVILLFLNQLKARQSASSLWLLLHKLMKKSHRPSQFRPCVNGDLIAMCLLRSSLMKPFFQGVSRNLSMMTLILKLDCDLLVTILDLVEHFIFVSFAWCGASIKTLGLHLSFITVLMSVILVVMLSSTASSCGNG